MTVTVGGTSTHTVTAATPSMLATMPLVTSVGGYGPDGDGWCRVDLYDLHNVHRGWLRRPDCCGCDTVDLDGDP